MKINIIVETENEGVVFTANSLSVESAVDELHRFERHVLPKFEKEIVF